MKPYKYRTEDIKKLIKQMIVLIDTREKKNSHILDYFRKQKIAYQVEKLEYNDYSFMIPAAGLYIVRNDRPKKTLIFSL